MVMGNVYWQNMWEGTMGLLKTLHQGSIPESFYLLAGETPKAMTMVESVSITSAP